MSEEIRKSLPKVLFLGGPRLLCLKLFIHSKIKTNGQPQQSRMLSSLSYCPQGCIRLVCIHDLGGLSSFGIQIRVLNEMVAVTS